MSAQPSPEANLRFSNRTSVRLVTRTFSCARTWPTKSSYQKVEFRRVFDCFETLIVIIISLMRYKWLSSTNCRASSNFLYHFDLTKKLTIYKKKTESCCNQKSLRFFQHFFCKNLLIRSIFGDSVANARVKIENGELSFEDKKKFR